MYQKSIEIKKSPVCTEVYCVEKKKKNTIATGVTVNCARDKSWQMQN